MRAPQFTYNAFVSRVYDGDTITCDIDLGFGIWKRNETIRLKSINAPEVRGKEREAGLKSRDYLREKILNQWVVLKTDRDRTGKYGRFIATVYLYGDSVNDDLIASGHAHFAIY